ncbi:UvrD-helicase domain-containing protein [Arthrobacter sp. BF1]|uniref:UvrD-helicase domain-containing protein n=1 Tax=Arthrobacter sp. BF1 TaxID=2821145 RepID=UPI001C4F2507|nr:UvrD-helicase domain-containing protein [Arthrobacter sp. BF1]
MTEDLAPISLQEVEWAREIMGLEGLDESRRDFISALTSVDVAACPGSGKTTMILAKLAILSERWSSKSSGVAVLSHTNVARDEVENRLGHSSRARLFLSYPHSIDTIHAFTNKFLATPWLLSHGYRASVVDDDAAARVRRRILGRESVIIDNALRKKGKSLDDVRLQSLTEGDPLGGSLFGLGSHTKSYQLATKAILASLEQGYVCFDEILSIGAIWSESDDNVVRALRARFPLALIDEMQDTTPLQNRVIDGIFHRKVENSPAILQRVGDLNQAIFADPTSPLVSDFPRLETRAVSISNSFRISPKVGRLANNLAVSPVAPHGLIGLRKPTTSPEINPNRIFVFSKNAPEKVLEKYAQHVASLFDDEELKAANVWAVGFRHKPAPDVRPGHAHYPKTVSHYWPSYNSDLSLSSFSPRTLAEYVLRASSLRKTEESSAAALQALASGILQGARIVNYASVSKSAGNAHRRIQQAVGTSGPAYFAYADLKNKLLTDSLLPNAESWPSLRQQLLVVIEHISASNSTSMTEFLQWPQDLSATDIGGSNNGNKVDPNIYTYHDVVSGKILDIKLGSIHAVKGQTHTATLLLETFTYSHHLKSLMARFLTSPDVPESAALGTRMEFWMRSAYVAMTRPTQSLCLAIPSQSIAASEPERKERIEALRGLGWGVEEL